VNKTTNENGDVKIIEIDLEDNKWYAYKFGMNTRFTRGEIVMSYKDKLRIVLSFILIFLMIFTIFTASMTSGNLDSHSATSSLVPPFSITDKRIGINSYIVTFNNPDNALINISIANYTTVHNFAINNTTSINLTIYANTIILAYWGNIEIGSLTLFYTSSVPTISVTSNSTENFVVIKVPQVNVFTVTISLKTTIIFSSILSLETTDIIYERYDSPTYINITTQNFTAASYEVLPPYIPQYSYKISVNPSINSNNTFSISYYVNMSSDLTLFSGNLFVFNKIINGSGVIYISRDLNATAVVLYHDNTTAFVAFLPLSLMQPEIENIYHNSTVYRNNTLIHFEKAVNVEYVALSFVAGIVVALLVAVVINKRRSKNE